MMRRWPGLDPDAIRASNRKQAVVPRGATVLDPVGTAPGLVVPPADGVHPTVVVLPGPPRELHPMWEMARETDAFRAAIAGATTYRTGVAAAVRDTRVGDRQHASRGGGRRAVAASRLRSRPACAAARSRSPPATSLPPSRTTRRWCSSSRDRHGDTLFSRDGSTVDEQVASLLAGRTVAVAESCTGGLMAARLTELRGLVGVLPRRRRRLLKRGQGRSRRRRPAADRAIRSGLDGGRRGARRRCGGPIRRRDRDRNHRNRRPRRRQRGEARRARVLLGQRPRRSADHAPHTAPRRSLGRPRAFDHGRDAPAAAAAAAARGRSRPGRGERAAAAPAGSGTGEAGTGANAPAERR